MERIVTVLDLPTIEADAYLEFKAAVRGLNDAEHCVKAAQERANRAVMTLQKLAIQFAIPPA